MMRQGRSLPTDMGHVSNQVHQGTCLPTLGQEGPCIRRGAEAPPDLVKRKSCEIAHGQQLLEVAAFHHGGLVQPDLQRRQHCQVLRHPLQPWTETARLHFDSQLAQRSRLVAHHLPEANCGGHDVTLDGADGDGRFGGGPRRPGQGQPCQAREGRHQSRSVIARTASVVGKSQASESRQGGTRWRSEQGGRGRQPQA